MSKLSIVVRIDDREVEVTSLERDGDAKFSAMDVAQLSALNATLVGCRTHGVNIYVPSRPDDLDRPCDKLVARLYEGKDSSVQST